jgi:hypothetical protein
MASRSRPGGSSPGPGGRLALLPGVVWRDHELTPSDPGSRLEDERFGVSLTADGEWRFGDRFGVMANGTYLTGFEDYWVQSRPFVDRRQRLETRARLRRLGRAGL